MSVIAHLIISVAFFLFQFTIPVQENSITHNGEDLSISARLVTTVLLIIGFNML